VRAHFENSNELGVFVKLTNAYCLVAAGNSDSVKIFEHELGDHIPVIYSSIAGCRILGRLTVGMKQLANLEIGSLEHLFMLFIKVIEGVYCSQIQPQIKN